MERAGWVTLGSVYSLGWPGKGPERELANILESGPLLWFPLLVLQHGGSLQALVLDALTCICN